MTSLAASISRDLSDSLTLVRVLLSPQSALIIELFMNGPHLATGRYEVGNPNLITTTSKLDLWNYAANGFNVHVLQ